MSLRKIKFGDKEVYKTKFYSSKQAISLHHYIYSSIQAISLHHYIYSSKQAVSKKMEN